MQLPAFSNPPKGETGGKELPRPVAIRRSLPAANQADSVITALQRARSFLPRKLDARRGALRDDDGANLDERSTLRSNFIG